MAAAGVRTNKGLYFTFTLLCLVCLASSLIDKDQLEKLKDDLQQSQQNVDRVKAEYELLTAFVSKEHVKMEAWNKILTELSDDFPPLEGHLENIQGVMEKTKTYLESHKEEIGAKIEEMEKKVRKMKKLVEFLEENQAEL